MFKLNPIMISGKEVFPLIEGGKGINASDGRSCGAWAHENCVGTFSGVSPDFYDENGNVVIERIFQKKRADRHAQMIEYAIKHFSINELTVNEQNPQAKEFYEHLGFKVYKRSEIDEQGNPYPILYMKLLNS